MKNGNVARVHTALQCQMETWMGRAKPYHHGNLREVLLESGLRLIAEVGPTGFTLRELARRAGVSHNAPYRHFRDRDDLMAAVATQGYRDLRTPCDGRQRTTPTQLTDSSKRG